MRDDNNADAFALALYFCGSTMKYRVPVESMTSLQSISDNALLLLAGYESITLSTKTTRRMGDDVMSSIVDSRDHFTGPGTEQLLRYVNFLPQKL